MNDKTFVWCIFLALFSISSSWAKSVENDVNKITTNEVASSKESTENNAANAEEELTPKDQLLYFTLVAFRDMSLEYVDLAANISESLLTDEDLQPNQSTTIMEFRKNITQFLEQYKKYDGIEELFNLVDFYSNTTSHYFELTAETSAADMLKIKEKLDKYGSDELDREFENLFMKFGEQFCQKFDEYKSKLSAEELQQEKVMFDWLEEFKSIQNAEEKIFSFEKFFRFYEE
ncbi:uncharacterized protein LOC106088295 [Stomoxys calcitrans]|uniref:Uncharacterized protein n=1 Tax=Stomoxys calcitrans TaxID=35570 RepID=A0A1I8PPF8_STOCA|nr:uncharacterized protein LOC106088295 [Stomoxys calcitrans]